jgi:hypothetical protein
VGDATHSLATYVSDMLAVEKNTRAPIDAQLNDKDFLAFQDTTDIVRRLSAMSGEHVAHLESMRATIGAKGAASAKAAVSSAGDAVAGLIDKVRKTKVSKALRDDYMTISFAIVSYDELLAIANGLDNAEVAALAQRHLEDYASVLMELGEAIPSVMLRELSESGVTVDTSTSTRTREQIRQSWRTLAPVARDTQEQLGSIRGDIVPDDQEPAWSPETGTPTT